MLCASQQAGRDGGVSLAQKFLESSFRDELCYCADVGSECAVRVHSWRHRPHYLVSLLGLGASAQRGQSEEHTSELQSPCNLVCRLLLEKKKTPARARR